MSEPYSGLFYTKRTDYWWVEPFLTAFGFLSFVVYTTWRAFSGVDFVVENYLSPFYSPLLFHLSGERPRDHIPSVFDRQSIPAGVVAGVEATLEFIQSVGDDLIQMHSLWCLFLILDSSYFLIEAV